MCPVLRRRDTSLVVRLASVPFCLTRVWAGDLLQLLPQLRSDRLNDRRPPLSSIQVCDSDRDRFSLAALPSPTFSTARTDSVHLHDEAFGYRQSNRRCLPPSSSKSSTPPTRHIPTRTSAWTTCSTRRERDPHPPAAKAAPRTIADSLRPLSRAGEARRRRRGTSRTSRPGSGDCRSRRLRREEEHEREANDIGKTTRQAMCT